MVWLGWDRVGSGGVGWGRAGSGGVGWAQGKVRVGLGWAHGGVRAGWALQRVESRMRVGGEQNASRWRAECEQVESRVRVGGEQSASHVRGSGGRAPRKLSLFYLPLRKHMPRATCARALLPGDEALGQLDGGVPGSQMCVCVGVGCPWDVRVSSVCVRVACPGGNQHHLYTT